MPQDKTPDGLAREGVRHLGAWSKTSWSLEEDSFGHLGAWSKTSWSKKDDIWGSRSLEYAIVQFRSILGSILDAVCSAGT